MKNIKLFQFIAFKSILIIIFGFLSFGNVAIAAEDCYRGTLDEAYCDRNMDQVADLPINPDEWVDPSTLIFTYTPVEDPAVYANIWSGFVDHLSKTTGKKVVFFPVESNAAQLEAMRSGRLHIAGFNTGSNPIAVSCAGFVPFGMMGYMDGSFGYEMEIIVKADSPIQSAAEAILKGEFDLVADRDFTPTFSGKHDNSILGVYNGDYEIASIANSVLNRMIRRGVIEEGSIRAVYRSATFPTTGYGHAHNLHPELVAKVKNAFWTFPWSEDELFVNEFKKADKFIGITHKFDWAVIRQIDAANEVSYDCK